MKMSKKIFSLMAMLVALGTVASGCGQPADVQTMQNQSEDDFAGNDQSPEESGNSTQVPTTEGVTEINFWYSWTDKIEENNLALTEEFNNTVGKKLGIHVTAEYQGTYEELHQKLQAAYVAGNMPEVSVMEIGSIKTFAQNGVIGPLDEYIKASDYDMGDFQDGLMKNSFIDDKCYAIPYLRSTPIMYMNADILKEAGLDPTKMNTWNDMKTYIETVYDKTGKYGMSMSTDVWLMEAFMLEHSSSILSDDEMSANMNNDKAKEIVNFFKDLIDKGAVKAYTKADYEKVKTDVMNKNVGIWYSSTGDFTYYNQVAKDCGFELQCCYIPMADNYGVTSGGCNLVMTSAADDNKKQAAWEFIKWMTEEDQTITASINTGYLPSRKSAVESDRINDIYKEIPQYKVALDQLQYSQGRPMNPGYVEASNELMKALDGIWVTGAEVDSTLDDLESKMNKLLDQ